MAFSTLIQSSSQLIMFLWILILASPIYLIFANLMANGLQQLYQQSRSRSSTLFQYVGDVSWLFPLKTNEQEFKLTHILLLSILIAVISLILIVAAMYQQQTEKFEIELRLKNSKKTSDKSKTL